MEGLSDGEKLRPGDESSRGSVLLDAVAALCILCVAYTEISSGITLAARQAGELDREVGSLIAEENQRAARSAFVFRFPSAAD
jgi:hypothetical protein